MWVIASIPFWLAALAIFIFGIASICLSFDERFQKEKAISGAENYLLVGICLMPVAGLVAVIAAKIAS